MEIDWKETSIIGLAVIVLFMILLSPTASEISIEQKLTNSGWNLYTISTCPACQLQKELFQNIDELNMIICDESEERRIECTETKITRVPTWINTNTKEIRIGYQELSQIEIMISD